MFFCHKNYLINISFQVTSTLKTMSIKNPREWMACSIRGDILYRGLIMWMAWLINTIRHLPPSRAGNGRRLNTHNEREINAVRMRILCISIPFSASHTNTFPMATGHHIPAVASFFCSSVLVLEKLVLIMVPKVLSEKPTWSPTSWNQAKSDSHGDNL